MGMDAKETPAYSDKACNVEDGVGCQLVHLKYVYDRKKATKELMGRRRQVAKEKSGEHNIPIGGRMGDYLFAGEHHVIIDRRHKARLPQLLQILWLEGGLRPSAGFPFRCGIRAMVLFLVAMAVLEGEATIFLDATVASVAEPFTFFTMASCAELLIRRRWVREKSRYLEVMEKCAWSRKMNSG
jgi:hypothetical protein